jgi:pimeloyl-ACP methyl ester carboxylesterase
VGRSLGSSLAIQVAAEEPVSRLVLITPFESILSIAKRTAPFLPMSLLLRDKYESWRYAPRVTCPTLVIAASHDELEQAGIPHSMPLEQFVPPKKGWPTPPMQMATAGQPLAPQFKTYEELAGSRARSASQKKLDLSRRISLEITVHLQIEEVLKLIFYFCLIKV